MSSTDTERAEFECIFSAPPYEFSMDKFDGTHRTLWGKQYRDYKVQCAWESWQAARRAPSADRGEIVVTKNDAGHIVAVTRQDEEGRILSVLSMSAPIYSATPVELPEPDVVIQSNHLDKAKMAPFLSRVQPATVSAGFVGLYTADTVRALIASATESRKRAQQELEDLKGKVVRIGIDVDRATKGIINDQSPIASRLRGLAELISSAQHQSKSRAQNDQNRPQTRMDAGAHPLPDGWQAVPIELTDGQAEAICLVANCCGGIAFDIYRAALEAAPRPPDAPGTKD